MQYLQNAPAYFAVAVSYMHKMFMKIDTIINILLM
jgi:hypothetical protein